MPAKPPLLVESLQSVKAPRLWELPVSPGAYLDQLNAQPVWFATFLLSVLLTGCAIFAMGPISTHVASLASSGTFAGPKRDQLLATLHAAQYLSLIFSPVFLMLKLSIQAFLLWGLVLVFSGDAKFKSLFALTNSISVYLTADYLFGILLNYVKGLDAIHAAGDIRSTMVGLSVFLRFNHNPLLKSTADAFSLASVWSVFIVFQGCVHIGSLAKGRAALCAIVYFFLQIGVALSLATIF